MDFGSALVNPQVFTPARITRMAGRFMSPQVAAAMRVAASPAGRKAGAFISDRMRYMYRRNKRRRTDGRSAVGQPPNKGAVKKDNMVSSDVFVRSTRELLATSMINVLAQTTQGSRINKRERNAANFVGFKIWHHAYNQLGFNPVCMHVAIVSRKNGSMPDNIGFFRAYENSRDQDFNTSLGSLEFHGLPINTDKYRVLMHKKCVLANANAGATVENTNTVNSWKTWDIWFPFKRQIIYEDGTNQDPQHNLFYVYWYDRMPEAKGVNGTVAVIEQLKIVSYFNDVQI